MKIIRNPNKRTMTNSRTRIYIRCENCRSNIRIHNQQNQQYAEIKFKSETIQAIKLLPSSSKQTENQKDALQKICDIKVLTISVQNDEILSLNCRKCEYKIGCLHDSFVYFFVNSVEETMISYKLKSQDKSNQELIHKNQSIYNYVRAYTTLSFAIIQQCFSKIDLSKIQKNQKKFLSFIKFYRQWQNRKLLGSTKKDQITSLYCISGSQCSIDKMGRQMNQ